MAMMLPKVHGHCGGEDPTDSFLSSQVGLLARNVAEGLG